MPTKAKARLRAVARAAKLDAHKRYVKRVKDRERRFQAMTLPRKRVAVAKDVIAALASRTIRAGHTYLNLPVHDPKTTKATEVQEILLQQPDCTACAIGAIFVCATLRNDKLNVEQFNRSSGCVHSNSLNVSRGGLLKTLQWLFPARQLGLIEAAFEMNDSFATREGCSYTLAWRAAGFGMRYGNDTSRLRAIMANIVENNGTFIPPGATDGQE